MASLRVALVALVASACGTFLGSSGDDDDGPAPSGLPPSIDGASVAPGIDASRSDVGPKPYDAGGPSDAPSNGDADAAPLLPKDRIVFVSSIEMAGDIGGTAAATAQCAALAANANLPGTFVAFLSGNGAQPTSVAGNGPWVLVDGTPAFDGNPLTNLPKVPLLRTEKNVALVGQTRVWTGIRPAALPSSIDATCIQWTSTATGGGFGLADQTASWKEQGGLNQCSNLARLYCFQL